MGARSGLRYNKAVKTPSTLETLLMLSNKIPDVSGVQSRSPMRADHMEYLVILISLPRPPVYTVRKRFESLALGKQALAS